MKKQRHPLLRNNVRQLAWLVLGFVVAIILLEAKGFPVWAQQKDVNAAQQNLLHLTQAVDRGLSTVAGPITEIRPKALKVLGEHGWSDVPQDLSEDLQEDSPQNTSKETQTASETPKTNTTTSIVESTTGVVRTTTNNTNQFDDSTKPIVLTPVETVQGGQTESAESTESTESAEAIPPVQNTRTVKAKLPVKQPGVDMKLTPLPQAKAQKPRHVALAGDSMMAVGLSGQLRRDLAEYKDSVTTVNAFRSATGLARPEVYDWMKKYPALTATTTPDVVIVAIGANDTQNLAVNKKVLTIGSEEWQEEYATRVEEYLNLLTKDGAVVLWLKLPPMGNKSKRYNDNVIKVNEVAYKVVAQNPSAIWWDPWARFLDKNGKFQDFGVVTEGGKKVRLRQEDGTHLTENGAKLITGDIVQWLNPAPVVKEEETQEDTKQEEAKTAETVEPTEPIPPKTESKTKPEPEAESALAPVPAEVKPDVQSSDAV